MSYRAWIYIWGVLLTGAVLSGLALPGLSHAASQWPVFAALTVLATLGHLAKARGVGHEAWHVNLVFLFAGVLLLHPFLFVLLVVIPHLIEWAKERLAGGPSLRNWYIQPFNIATHIIAGSAARWTLTLLRLDIIVSPTAAAVLAIAVATLVYLALNHALVAVALVLARGVPWRETGLLDRENLVSDLALLILGYVVAALWNLNPWLILLAPIPLALMNRALMVPRLKKETRIDEKTGLWNIRHFAELFTAEMNRARRVNRPLTLITVDLDPLPNAHDTYGHVVSDAVLAGIGQIIRHNLRPYDIAARCAGEEFAIVLPETELAQARSVAERLRDAVEKTPFEVKGKHRPIQVTVSLGVASYPHHTATLDGLVHASGAAMRRAKLNGCNRVATASEVPQNTELEGVPADRLPLTFAT